jgi:hypothetical protein
MKKVLNFLKTLLRAGVKSFPIGNAIVEAVENRKSRKAIEKAVETGNLLEGSPKVKMVDGKPENPHDYLSIAFQLLIVSAIVYAFATKQITIEKLIELLNGAF